MNALRAFLAGVALVYSGGAFAQSEFEGCESGSSGRLICPNGMRCQSALEGARLDCNTGLQCLSNAPGTSLVCNTGSVYSVQDGTLLVPPSRARPNHLPMKSNDREMQSDRVTSQEGSCETDGGGTTRCANGLVCQRDKAAGLIRCNNGKTCSLDSSGSLRCNDGRSAQTDSSGLTRYSNGTSSTTDRSGLTRFSDGSYCMKDQSGLRKCFPPR